MPKLWFPLPQIGQTNPKPIELKHNLEANRFSDKHTKADNLEELEIASGRGRGPRDKHMGDLK